MMPLPKEEVTPPVTKIYLVAIKMWLRALKIEISGYLKRLIDFDLLWNICVTPELVLGVSRLSVEMLK
jgi:hypothetical protein